MKTHKGPRNMLAITTTHIKEHGRRPVTDGLTGPARKEAQIAQARWDSGLLSRSRLIAEVVNNGICKIGDDGHLTRE